MGKTLWDLSLNENAEVVGFNPELEESYRVRLLEFGFHPGEKVTCLLSTPLGAPRLYRVNQTVYSLDDQIAKMVQMKESSSS